MNYFFKIFFLIFSLTFTLKAATPTTNWEFGVQLGTAYYIGELNDIHFYPLRPSGGLVLRYNYDSRISVRSMANWGRISASDDNIEGGFSKVRNTSFRNDVIELGAVFEFNFTEFSTYALNTFDKKSSIVSPYVYLGLAYFYHNPQINIDGTYRNASNFVIEGNTYRLNQLSMPMGIGLKFRMNNFGLGLDWGIRGTLTDYLDDISTYYEENVNSTASSGFQRGNKFNNDWYVFTGVSLFFNLTQRRICPN